MRLVATDLDGTLLRADGSASPRTRAALGACFAAGVDVVMVTGRPVRWMAPVADLADHHGTAVCSNGAVRYDLHDERVVSWRALSCATVLAAAAALRVQYPNAHFALETLQGFRREADYEVTHEDARRAPVGELAELVADEPQVIKLLWRGRNVSADAMLAVARTALTGIASPVHSGALGSLIEISALGVDKASGLAELVAERGIDPADVVAFGDMPNDVPMLVWAGRSYAMADAHPEALAAAADTAPSCADDGVAQVIERLLAAL